MFVSKFWCAYDGHVVGALGCWRLTGQCQEMEDSGGRLPAPWAGPRSLSSHSHSRHKSAHTSMIISDIIVCISLNICFYFCCALSRPFIKTQYNTFATFNKPKLIFNLLVQCLGSPEYKPGIIESSSKLVFFFQFSCFLSFVTAQLKSFLVHVYL